MDRLAEYKRSFSYFLRTYIEYDSFMVILKMEALP